MYSRLFLSGLIYLGFILTLAQYPVQSNAAICTAVANGNWEDVSTWSSAKPVCGDSIIIPAGKTVTIVHTQEDYSSCMSVMVIDIYGTLQFVNGFKLRLNCVSIIYLHAGALITISGGGGSNNLIEVCNNVMWRAACGNLSGPLAIPPYDCDVPVPITLVSFSAERKNNECVLSWITGAERNNDYFSIERSADAKNFETLDKIAGAGNSSTNRYYSFTDGEPLTGTSYYRLKQIDYNGAYTISKMVGFHTEDNDVEMLKVWVDQPNESITFLFTGDEEQGANYVINDMLGKKVLSGFLTQEESHKHIIRCAGLAHGLYFIRVENSHSNAIRKFFY